MTGPTENPYRAQPIGLLASGANKGGAVTKLSSALAEMALDLHLAYHPWDDRTIVCTVDPESCGWCPTLDMAVVASVLLDLPEHYLYCGEVNAAGVFQVGRMVSKPT